MTLRIYTDASFRQMDNLGSWAIISDKGWNRSGTIHNKELDIAYLELYAVQQAIIQSIGYDEVHIYTDSDYVYTNLNIKAEEYEQDNWNNHKKGFLTKKDLLRQTYKLYNNNPQIIIHKVKAHNGNEMNEKADSLARETLTESLHLLRVEIIEENTRLLKENLKLQQSNEELYDLLQQYRAANNHLSELLADATRKGYSPPLPENMVRIEEPEKRRLSPCPMNMISFLSMKGLLKKEFLFSERLKLENEFMEWCEKGGMDDG